MKSTGRNLLTELMVVIIYLRSHIRENLIEARLCLSERSGERSVAPPPRCDPWLLEIGGVCLIRKLDV